jgi:release factor glutamine methyltransferase
LEQNLALQNHYSYHSFYLLTKMQTVATNTPLTYQEKVRHRAESLLKRHRQHLASYLVKFKNLQLLMMPEVFCASYADGSQLLADVLEQEVRPGDVFLDMGTGSGAMAIVAARQGCKKVVAIDISPVSVACAKNNVDHHAFTKHIDVRQGNLFNALQPEEKFSLIAFNPPFMDGCPNDWLEAAMYDSDYKTLKRFFSEFPGFLKPSGRLLIVFSEAGNVQMLEALMQKSGMKFEMVKSDLPANFNLKVLTYKLSKPSP